MDEDNCSAILRVLKELRKMDLVHAANARSDGASARDENVSFAEDLLKLVCEEVRKAMQAGRLPQGIASMKKRELKLPKYSD